MRAIGEVDYHLVLVE